MAVDVVAGQEGLGVGDPQVCRASVKHDHLLLSRRAHLDLPIVLGVPGVTTWKI